MDHITVKMVCQRAGVSRQTLYNHYYCLTDVLGDMMQRELEELGTETKTCRGWRRLLLSVLTALRARKPVVLNIWRSSYRADFLQMLEQMMGETLGQELIRCMGEEDEPTAAEDQAFMQDVFLFVFMGLTRRYIAECMEEPPEAVAERCGRMLGNPMCRRFLETDQKRGEKDAREAHSEDRYGAAGAAAGADASGGGMPGRR